MKIVKDRTGSEILAPGVRHGEIVRMVWICLKD